MERGRSTPKMSCWQSRGRYREQLTIDPFERSITTNNANEAARLADDRGYARGERSSRRIERA